MNCSEPGIYGWPGAARAWHTKLVQAGRRALCVWVAAVLVACTGGQSGTETPTPRDDAGPSAAGEGGGPIGITSTGEHCACSLSQRNALLRATLIELERCRVRARVEEVLAVAPGLALQIAEGDELDAARDVGCGQPPDLGPGDAALLVYAPGPDEGGSTALVATWGSEHVFGMQGAQSVVLPQRERERLLESEACSEWFAGQEPPAADSMAEPAVPGECAR
jgi:hypothetical protein